MKFVQLLFLMLSIAVLALLGNASGALPENTGAPSELTCGRSPCHNIPANNGSGEVVIDVDNGMESYIASDTHSISITLENSVTVKNGFEILALDANNGNAGEWMLTEPTLMKVINGFSFPNRSYITHTSAGNQLSTWSFDWVAPDMDVGDVTFYVSVLATNSNNQNSGDTLYNLSKVISFDNAVSTSNFLLEAEEVNVYPNPVGDWLNVEGLDEFPANAILYNSAGKKVRNFSFLNSNSSFSVNGLQSGIYYLKIQLENGFFTKKILKI